MTVGALEVPSFSSPSTLLSGLGGVVSGGDCDRTGEGSKEKDKTKMMKKKDMTEEEEKDIDISRLDGNIVDNNNDGCYKLLCDSLFRVCRVAFIENRQTDTASSW
jgi:hypothetical protein